MVIDKRSIFQAIVKIDHTHKNRNSRSITKLNLSFGRDRSNFDSFFLHFSIDFEDSVFNILSKSCVQFVGLDFHDFISVTWPINFTIKWWRHGVKPALDRYLLLISVHQTKPLDRGPCSTTSRQYIDSWYSC